MARSGLAVPSYSYALNNPIKNKDKDGNVPYMPDCVVAAGLSLLISEYLRGPHQSDGMLHCTAACYLVRNCGPGSGYLLGLLKEYVEHYVQGDEVSRDDIRANALGEQCGLSGLAGGCGLGSTCEDCCKKRLREEGIW